MPVAKSPDKHQLFANFCGSFAAHGMCVLGGIVLKPDYCPADFKQLAGHCGLLIGNHGPGMWDRFSSSVEADDGKPNPLDRWTLRVLRDVVSQTECVIFHPSHTPY